MFLISKICPFHCWESFRAALCTALVLNIMHDISLNKCLIINSDYKFTLLL